MISLSFAKAFHQAEQDLQNALSSIHKGRVYEALSDQEKRHLHQMIIKYIQLKGLHTCHYLNIIMALLMGCSVLFFSETPNLIFAACLSIITYSLFALPGILVGSSQVWRMNNYFQNSKAKGNLYLFGITQCYQCQLTAEAPQDIIPYIQATPEKIEHMLLENISYSDTLAKFAIVKRDHNYCRVTIVHFCIELLTDHKDVRFYFEPSEDVYTGQSLEASEKDPFLNSIFRFPVVKAMFDSLRDKGWATGELLGAY
jgi:hypothetical protein